MKKYKVYGIGAALVDTEIKVDDTDLANMNVEKGLMTLVDEDRLKELLGHLEGHLITAVHSSGGSGGNSVIASALFGAPAFMSCKVANDIDGDIYIADLEAAGVDHSMTGPRENGITGKCLVLITPDAERSMNSYLAINDTLSVDQVDSAAIENSEWVYIEGYRVTADTSREAAIRTREIAQAAGVKTALSFSDPGMVEFFRDGMQEIIGEKVDLIFCNEAEAKGWSDTQDLNVAIEGLKKTASSFALTKGDQGAIVFDGSTTTEIPVHRVHALDSNGAGDMFAGAFLYALTRGEDFATAGRFAGLCAGKIVANYGPRLAEQDYADLRIEFFGE